MLKSKMVFPWQWSPVASVWYVIGDNPSDEELEDIRIKEDELVRDNCADDEYY